MISYILSIPMQSWSATRRLFFSFSVAKWRFSTFIQIQVYHQSSLCLIFWFIPHSTRWSLLQCCSHIKEHMHLIYRETTENISLSLCCRYPTHLAVSVKAIRRKFMGLTRVTPQNSISAFSSRWMPAAVCLRVTRAQRRYMPDPLCLFIKHSLCRSSCCSSCLIEGKLMCFVEL